MANPHKGEVAFDANGKTYKLSFSANAMVEVEEVLGMAFDDATKMLSDGKGARLAMIRKMFWQGLLDHQPDMTLDDTKVVLKHVPPADMGRLLGEALTAAMPVGAANGQDAAANPPQPGAPTNGIGPGS